MCVYVYTHIFNGSESYEVNVHYGGKSLGTRGGQIDGQVSPSILRGDTVQDSGFRVRGSGFGSERRRRMREVMEAHQSAFRLEAAGCRVIICSHGDTNYY